MAVTILMDTMTESLPDLDFENLARQVAQEVLEMEACPYDAQVNLLLTDNRGIREYNRQFRDIDRETDVLSFPAVDFETPADYALLEEDDSCFDLDTGELLLGDIVISVEKALSQAEEYGHGIKREFCFLVAHSMLHLLGYDHMEAQEAAVMEQKQEQALAGLGITRS